MNQRIEIRKGEQIPATQPEHFVGTLVECEFDHVEYLFLVISEVNHTVDLLNGEPIYNPRRNKYWGLSLPSKEVVCICIDWYLEDELKRIKFYQPVWELVQTNAGQPTAEVRSEDCVRPTPQG